jgi:hypothetical protein
MWDYCDVRDVQPALQLDLVLVDDDVCVIDWYIPCLIACFDLIVASARRCYVY